MAEGILPMPSAYLPVFFTRQTRVWSGGAGSALCSEVLKQERHG